MFNYTFLTSLGNLGSGSLHQLILIGSIILVFYFFMIRPQYRRQREQKNFLDQIKKGEPLISIGGIHGRVYEVSDDTVTLEIDNKGSKITIAKNAISLEASQKQGK